MLKNFIQSSIKNFLLKFRIGIYKGIPHAKILSLIKKLKPHDLGYNLIRIGSKHDGGYLIPNLLSKIDFCISPGVDKTISFEKQLKDKFLIKSFLLDHTVDPEEEFLKEFDFTQKKLGIISTTSEITLEDFYNSKIKNNSENGILQIDIEGDEYKVLISTPDQILKKFKVIIVEFHDLDRISNKFNFSIIESLLDKILLNFEVGHIHPNNFSKNISFSKNIIIPEILEVTFLRKDLILKKEKIKGLPHKLDSKNVPTKKDIFLKGFF